MKFLPDYIGTAQNACGQFESDLSAFVDGELATLDAAQVSAHVEVCDACRAHVRALAELSRMNRARGAAALVEKLGTKGLWAGMVHRLMADNEARLVPVLYGLGKALIAAGLDSSAEVRGLRIYQKKPGSIRVLSRKGTALAREHGRIRARLLGWRRSGLNLRRGGLFPAHEEETRGSAALDAGAVCLEQCLILSPGHHEARIYLAHYHRMTGRSDLARRQLMRVLRDPQAAVRTRLIANQQLSRIFSAGHQFLRALENERDVLAQARAAGDELLQVGALTNQVIYAVKCDRFDAAETALDELAGRFPDRLEALVVPAFQKARDFRRILTNRPDFLAKLRSRYPRIFAL